MLLCLVLTSCDRVTIDEREELRLERMSKLTDYQYCLETCNRISVYDSHARAICVVGCNLKDKEEVENVEAIYSFT